MNLGSVPCSSFGVTDSSQGHTLEWMGSVPTMTICRRGYCRRWRRGRITGDSLVRRAIGYSWKLGTVHANMELMLTTLPDLLRRCGLLTLVDLGSVAPNPASSVWLLGTRLCSAPCPHRGKNRMGPSALPNPSLLYRFSQLSLPKGDICALHVRLKPCWLVFGVARAGLHAMASSVAIGCLWLLSAPSRPLIVSSFPGRTAIFLHDFENLFDWVWFASIQLLHTRTHSQPHDGCIDDVVLGHPWCPCSQLDDKL